jgi:hypothetical protein
MKDFARYMANKYATIERIRKQAEYRKQVETARREVETTR